MRGFAITLDGVIALLMIFLSIMLINLVVAQFGEYTFQENQLHLISYDVLSVMEKNGYLEGSLTNTTMVREILENTPNNLCMTLSVYQNGSSTANYSITKSGCSAPEGDMRVARRSFIVNRGGTSYFYTAKLESWYG